jgi:hypothetical protein
MNLKQALVKLSINSVSNSLSVYQGPPVKAMDGSSSAIIYNLRVGCWKREGWYILENETANEPERTPLFLQAAFALRF